MSDSGFSPWPCYSELEVQEVARVLASNRVNYWTGEETKSFEREFATWTGSAYAVAVANGTVALEIALRGLGIGPGDEVVVTPRTFIASVSCVVNAGAIPVFADVEPDSGNISARTIAAVIGPKTRAIICVHLAGWPCDMDPIMALAAKHGLKVIEDCAQAHGARYKGRSVGSMGDVGAWSFCQDKIMTTGGEGGMLTTNHESLWRSMWSFKDHGKSYEAVYERQHPPGFRWLHDSFGTNGRMLEMQAVLGRIQLNQMADWTRQRLQNMETIWATCRRHEGLRVPHFQCGKGCDQSSVPCAYRASCQHAAYRCYVYVEPSKLKPEWCRDRILEALQQHGIPSFSGSCSEVYLEAAFQGSPWRPADRLPTAKLLGETSLAFLVHPNLTPSEIDATCRAIDEVMAEASL